MLEHSGEKILKFLDIKDSEIYIITAHQSNTQDVLLPTAITNQTKSAKPAKRKPKEKRKQIQTPSNSSSCSTLRLEEDDIEAKRTSSIEKCHPILKDIMNEDPQKIFAVPVDPVACIFPHISISLKSPWIWGPSFTGFARISKLPTDFCEIS
jgi:hypothetical protein